MATLALSTDFLGDYAKLEQRQQRAVQKIAHQFQEFSSGDLHGNSGFKLERHTNQRDPRARTVRIDQGTRGIVLDAGEETFVLVAIGNHDDTDRWMAKNVFQVNAATGALEILDVEAIEAKAAEPVVNPGGSLLFEHRSDKDFTQLGVPEALVLTLRALTEELQLLSILELVSESQATAISRLLEPDVPVEAIYAEITGLETQRTYDTDDVVTALASPISQATFHVVDGQDELRDMLDKPLAIWRTFLHPSQERHVDRDFKGPARVTGGAGTGKTVVAIHRARSLARRLDDRAGKPILFTTYTRNLAQAIEDDLRSLGGRETLDVVEVSNIDVIARRIVQEVEGSAPGLARADDVQQRWEDAVTDLGSELDPAFVGAEWEQVVLAQGLTSRSDYFQASRAGRGVPLDRRARAEVWRVIEAFNRAMLDAGQRTFLQLAHDAAGYLAGRETKPYRHVVVDEAQDLHAAQWRLIRALAPEGHNDLFIVGDSHQRIYDHRSSLKKVGINVVGRSAKLRINYRTTYQILGWAMQLLGEGDFDDLDEGADPQTIAGYHSFRGGPTPELIGAESAKEQNDQLVAKVHYWIDGGIEPEEIGIAVRGRSSMAGIAEALREAGVEVIELKRDQPKGAGVRIGTMHRMKGLEFRCVAIADVDDRRVPSPAAITSQSVDPAQHASDLQRELCLLYVAATRARDQLVVSWNGTPSRFLGVFES